MDGVVVDRGGGWPRHKRAPVAKERDDLAFVLGPHIRRPTILADNAAPFTPLLSLSLSSSSFPSTRARMCVNLVFFPLLPLCPAPFPFLPSSCLPPSSSYPRPFRVPGRCGSRGLSAKVRKDNRSPRGTHRSMIQHERKPTGRQEIAVPGRTQIWIYAGPGTALVCHACKSAGG